MIYDYITFKQLPFATLALIFCCSGLGAWRAGQSLPEYVVGWTCPGKCKINTYKLAIKERLKDLRKRGKSRHTYKATHELRDKQVDS